MDARGANSISCFPHQITNISQQVLLGIPIGVVIRGVIKARIQIVVNFTSINKLQHVSFSNSEVVLSIDDLQYMNNDCLSRGIE